MYDKQVEILTLARFEKTHRFQIKRLTCSFPNVVNALMNFFWSESWTKDLKIDDVFRYLVNVSWQQNDC